jgi:hypothetical protein
MSQDKPTPAQLQDGSWQRAQQMQGMAAQQAQLVMSAEYIARMQSNMQSNMGAPETYSEWFYKNWRPLVAF